MGRFRSKSIGFRMSPEEYEMINLAVSLSGIPKQDYIVSKLLDRTVVVKGNCKLHRAVYDRLTQVLNELVRIENGADVDEELLDRISMIVGLIDSLYSKTTA